MQEFSSISVSSYEPGTLADRLTEQSADGWSVITIVPTGSTVTAFLTRQARSSSGSTSSSPGEQASEPSPVSGVGPATSAAPLLTDDEAKPSEPDSGIDVADGDGPGMGASEEAIEPVDEPGGWAVSPESAHSGSASGSGSGTSEAEPSLPSSGSGETRSWSGSDTDNDSASAASSGGAASATAPAGWYADPSSRYELRYWDGSQWTEHVSRAGQQFTDPPVA